MAIVKPFSALRPKSPSLASLICELPYDVLSSEEAREMAAENPLSFFHVSKPEIDFASGTNPSSPAVYAKGKENFRGLIEQGVLVQDPHPSFYLYRQISGSHSQLGLVATTSCEEYLQNIIKKHELTRPEKEDDRVNHIEALDSQTGPVFLTYQTNRDINLFLESQSKAASDIDITTPDAVRHTAWTISEPQSIRWIQEAFASIPSLYIADGHHRSAAAARVYQSRRGQGSSGYFLSVIFPHDQLQILPYNRALKDLNGNSPAQILAKLSAVFEITQPSQANPTRKHELGFYIDGKWHRLSFRPQFAASEDPSETLDVALLQKYVLAPLFGIDDPRKSQRIHFVGGIRGTGELEKLVNSKDYSCAFSMFPTSIDDLMQIADAGGIMPPKSTWFEPKLRDAMFCHLI